MGKPIKVVLLLKINNTGTLSKNISINDNTINFCWCLFFTI